MRKLLLSLCLMVFFELQGIVQQCMPNLRKQRVQNKQYYIHNQESKKSASSATYSADPDRKKAASHAKYHD